MKINEIEHALMQMKVQILQKKGAAYLEQMDKTAKEFAAANFNFNNPNEDAMLLDLMKAFYIMLEIEKLN